MVNANSDAKNATHLLLVEIDSGDLAELPEGTPVLQVYKNGRERWVPSEDAIGEYVPDAPDWKCSVEVSYVVEEYLNFNK